MWISWDGVFLARLFEGVKKGRKIHRAAQSKLWSIGKDLGFYSESDFEFPNLVEKGVTSKIDVVWESDNKIVFAFEIRIKPNNLDIITTRQDVAELKNLEACKKFIVNVSSKSGKAYFIDIETYQKS